MARFGGALSVLDFLSLGSSLSLRSFSRLGSAVAVLSYANLGSSLSLRGLVRLGSAFSVCGMVRLSSSLSVLESVCIPPTAQLSMPSWTINWDNTASELQFKTGSTKVLAVSTSGGSLHGTWMSESMVSASDHRLKQEVESLQRSLLRKQGEAESSGIASDLLRLFAPGPGSLQLEASERAFQALPGVVRQMPSKDGRRLGISYQDLLAVITLAAKERQQRLELLEAQEAAEVAQQDQQEGLIQALLKQVEQLSTRLDLLRYRSRR